MDLLMVFFICFPCSVFCSPPPSNQEDTTLFANEFMTRFGYLRKEGSLDESLVRLEDAVKQVQRFGGLAPTGELDLPTLQLMKSPRCGLPDIEHSTSAARSKRYVLSQTGGWTKQHLTYFISSWNSHLGRDTVRAELQKALNAWAKYGNLQFQEVFSTAADIVVKFGKRNHGDDYPFDGPGMVLAHAFPPGVDLGGDIHFDDEETWQVNPTKSGANIGEDLFSVAVHEVGHSLGLAHSPDQQAVMYPYYKQHISASFALGSDDIAAMHQLYYKKSKSGYKSDDGYRKPLTTTTTTKKPTTRVTIRTTRSQPLVTFNHQPHHRHPFQRDPNKRYPGQRRPDQWYPDQRHPDQNNPDFRYPGHHGPSTAETTSKSHPGTPNICEGHFDAVSLLRGEIFVFKDDYVWRLSSPGRVEPGYPAHIHRMFPQLPETLHKLDAVYQRGTDSNLIFFSGDKFWVHDGNRVVEGPRPLSDYGLPQYVRSVDAAIFWRSNGKTYIFSENRYWRFDENLGSADPGYPRPMELFRGVPKDFDSAMTWSDDETYFFKDNLYWAFNNSMLMTQPSYPRNAAQHWLGCHDHQPRNVLHFNLDQLDAPKSSSAMKLKDLNRLSLVLVVSSLLFINAVF